MNYGESGMKKMNRTTLGMALALALAAAPAAADERESFEVLKQTTVNLIDALVDNGVLMREKADALIRQAEKKAAQAAAAKGRERGGAVRVQYVPEVVKNQIREEIKQEVLAQAKNERWAEPNAIPSWLDRIKWEGDVRFRYQADLFDSGNTTAQDYVNTACLSSVTRAGGLSSPDCGLATGNATKDRNRLRLRARLGMLAKITESWSAGFRLSTGSSTDRVSTNQSLGQEWNKYTVLFDRAYLKFDPLEWLTVAGGRIPNPWFSTDLVWDEDLNFEGIAATLKPAFSNNTIKPFLTVGIFPLKEANPPSSSGRWVRGIQGGTQWDFNSNSRLKLGLGYYDYRDIEGRIEPDNTEPGGLAPSAAYGQYEYGSRLRQKGNTLFRTNALTDLAGANIWGLASKFRPINLTASLDLAHFDPVHVVLTADWVKNTAFDRGEIFRRTRNQLNLTDGKDYGYQYKLTVGMPQVKEQRDWQVYAAYRWLGSDAVVDAFTDSDFGLGGTNLKGYILGAQYGLDRNAVLGLRWMSADAIDSFTLNPAHKFSVDVFQADVSLRF